MSLATSDSSADEKINMGSFFLLFSLTAYLTRRCPVRKKSIPVMFYIYFVKQLFIHLQGKGFTRHLCMSYSSYKKRNVCNKYIVFKIPIYNDVKVVTFNVLWRFRCSPKYNILHFFYSTSGDK